MTAPLPENAMISSEAVVATPFASRYLSQLCKHFEHRRAVTWTASRGRIAFDLGICSLAADGERLVLRAEAADAAGLEQLEGVVARHLARFAFRDPPEVRWQRG